MGKIRIYGDPVLRKKSLPVDKIDNYIKQFIDEMVEDMYAYDGVGLAAPQVGVNKRIAIVDPTAGEMEYPYVFINPEIYWESDEKGDYEEGCLSIPGINAVVKRPVKISVRAYNKNGELFELQECDGLLARAIQHEIDHLDGILFVDRIGSVKRQMLAGKLKKLAKSYKEYY